MLENLPPQTLNDVSELVGISPSQLVYVLATYKCRYRAIEGSGDKERTFYEPADEIRRLQTRINEWLKSYPLLEHVDGWREGRSARSSASHHVRKAVLLKIDIKSFFPSIHYQRVYALFNRLGCSKEAAQILTKLTTADCHLPQGFITSPTIANLVLRGLDSDLAKMCRAHHVTLRRYGDDISISAKRIPSDLVTAAKHLVRKNGFKINEEKFNKSGITYRNERQVVCGIQVNNGVKVPDQTYEYCRTELIHCIAIRHSGNEVATIRVEEEKARLRGWISHIQDVNKKQGKKLHRLFVIAFPGANSS